MRIVETGAVRPSGYWPDDLWMFAAWQSNSPGKFAESTQTFTRVESWKGKKKATCSLNRFGKSESPRIC